MNNPLSDQLRVEADRLDVCATMENDHRVSQPLDRLAKAAHEIGAAWSGSPLGYQARVYYAQFQPPPPGAHFSSEWGFFSASIVRTIGDWKEYSYEEVRNVIFDRAGNPDLSRPQSEARRAREIFDSSRAECLSILSIHLELTSDSYIRELKSKTEQLAPITEANVIRGQLPNDMASRDSVAMVQGIGPAPHQEILARVVALRSDLQVCAKLSTLALQAASHIDRQNLMKSSVDKQIGDRIFIGHGHSQVWRELKDFISDRLRLPWDEFNRVEVAGTSTIARLQKMLDDAAFAFLVLTAEDEQASGAQVARQNVIHESGLFQGRLGFERAIIMLEEGCEEFTNIHGLSQLRFPPGRIDTLFERVRQVLEREGLIS